jgi:two-component system, NtrC family, response regulator HydG
MTDTILIVDDEPYNLDLLEQELTDRGFAVERARSGAEALQKNEALRPDLVLLDYMMPGMHGLEVLREIRAGESDVPVVVMTAHGSIEVAVEAMKLGAYDYLTKPTKIEELDIVIRKAAEKGQLMRDNVALRAHAPGAEPYGGLLTRSPKMQDVLRIIERVAPTDSSVLILGESGTGKELVARAIHERSARAARPFVPIHCGALPREVLESELFGHEKGAFTGAVNAKPGLVDLADGGTLFLDEIGEMEPDSQVKVLRALETGMFFRVGGTRPRSVDIRIVAATNRDLGEAMRAGEFRQDLYYRINTITVSLPPLRERRDDIPLLAQHFVESKAAYGAKRLTAATLAVLEAYAWPGNVRELLHAIERGVILSKGEDIEPGDLPPEVLGAGAPPATPVGSLESIERTHIVTTLRQVSGHRGKAAALLGIDPKTLYRKIIGYQIKAEEFR